jgi:hypothetical protein
VPGAGLKQAERGNKFHNRDETAKITKFIRGICIVRFSVLGKANRNLQNTWCLQVTRHSYVHKKKGKPKIPYLQKMKGEIGGGWGTKNVRKP